MIPRRVSKLLRVVVPWRTPSTAWQSRINDLEPDSLPSFFRAFFIPSMPPVSLCLPSFFLPGIVKRHPAKRAAENEVLETTRCRLFIKKMQMSSKWGEENSKEATRNTSCASRIHRVVCRFTINYLNFVVNTVEVVTEELLTLCTRRKIAL